MSKDFVVAVDQGTSGTKCYVFDNEGRVVGSDFRRHRQSYPRPGWVEEDPMEIWGMTKLAIRGALKKGRVPGKNVAAVGVANQRETVVAWNPESGRPFYNAIGWQDMRTAARCAELSRSGRVDDLVRPVTGLFAHPYFSAAKVEWLMRNVPKLREGARSGGALIGTIDSWLIWNLTRTRSGGEFLTDPTNASRTMLMDLRRIDWSDDLMDLFGVPKSVMAEIRPSSGGGGFGTTMADGPFGAKVPIAGDLGDQQAAFVGQACFSPGDAKCTYGTGAFLLRGTGSSPVRSNHGLLSTVGYAFGKQTTYALEGSVAAAGSAIGWLKENLGIVKSERDAERLARSVADEGSGGVYFVPAFSGLYAPRWDPMARGLIVGLTQFTRREHVAHAAFEGICWQVAEVFDAMADDGGGRPSFLRVDGGGAEDEYLMQLQADVIGVDVVRPTVLETTARGAAFAAGIAVGFWEGLSEVERLWRQRDRFPSKWSAAKRREGRRAWRSAVERAGGWLGEAGGNPF